jgi:hypothetical protein
LSRCIHSTKRRLERGKADLKGADDMELVSCVWVWPRPLGASQKNGLLEDCWRLLERKEFVKGQTEGDEAKRDRTKKNLGILFAASNLTPRKQGCSGKVAQSSARPIIWS